MAKLIDEKDTDSLLKTNQNQQFNEKNVISTFFFSWVYPILKIGKKNPLVQEDLVVLDSQNSSKKSYHKFIKKSIQGQLASSLYTAFRKQILIQFILYLAVSGLSLGLPLITEISQTFFMYDDPADKPTNQDMLVFVGVFFLYMISLSLIKPFQQFQASLISLKLQGSLQQEIFLKALKFPIHRSQQYTIGELINLLQVDITQASNYFANAIILFTCPLLFVISGIVFYLTLGKKAVVLFIGALVQGVVGIAFGYFYGVVQKKYMIAKDNRMKSVDEALLFSKQVKLNTLENFFETRVLFQVIQDLTKKNKRAVPTKKPTQGVIGLFTWEVMFVFQDQLNFAIISIMMQNYQSLLNLLENLPIQLKNYQMSSNSISRLNAFFQQSEFQAIETINTNNDISIEIQNASYDWKCNDQAIENNIHETSYQQIQNLFQISLDIKIKKGQYVAFVGGSASGKSTILKSILGETYYKQGRITVNGIISVATQEPWIISGSIKKNITFMNQFDGVKYKKVIKICGLERDLSLFKNGDDTILSEKGDNLSGGQQKRINLARAVYNDADIYLLDDPMSALDIKVKYQIYQQCIQGYLKDKTRILFTNSLSNLQECDMIYMVENGQIVKQGTFAELTGAQEDSQLYSQKEIIDLQFEEQHYKSSNNDQDARASLIQQEDQEKGDISKSVQSQVFNFVGGYCCVIVTIVYFVSILSCQLLGNALIAQDDISDSDYKAIAIKYYPLIQLPILVAQVLLKSYYLIKGLSTSKFMHQNVICSLLNASYTKFYNTILIGRLMNRLSKDIYNIDLLFPSELQNLTFQFTTLLLPLFACFLYLNLVALPLIIIFFVILIYLTYIYYKCLREITRIEAVSKSPVFTFFQQIVRGILYVRTCVCNDKLIVAQQRNVDVDLGNQINLNGFQQWYQSLAGVVTNIFQSFLFILCFLFPGSSIKLTNLVLNQMQTVSQLLLNATISYGNIQMYFISFERCLHLANKIELEERFVPMITPSGDPNPEPEKKSDEQEIVLNLKNCTFQYRSNSKSVLSTINFKLHKGEKIGVVGRTGAGKSSIILALTQVLEQTEGHIEIEGKNVNLYSINEIRQKYAIIPQDPIIFMGTLKENLDPLNQFSEARILEVVEDCGLLQMQSFKQNGLQSEISLSGGNLSQGEKQLLNIVRCILEDKQIILVDEATANIDLQTEELVKQLFEKYFKSAAMLTIAHKVTTIMNSDKIMVINDGMITEFDHPQKLLSNPNSEFKQILDLINQAEQL